MSNRILLRSPSARRSFHWLRYFVALLLFLSLFFLAVSGRLLVRDQPLSHYQWALVLDGQGPLPYRSDASMQLMKQGWIDSVALSGVPFFRYHTSGFALEDLQRKGADLSNYVELRHYATSTWGEAQWLVSFFREREVDTVLLVTSGYHTARAARIFNAIAKGEPHFVTVDIRDPQFRPWGWWNDREAAAVWFTEWSKTVLTYAELLFKGRDLIAGGPEVVVATARPQTAPVAPPAVVEESLPDSSALESQLDGAVLEADSIAPLHEQE